ncbi:MAG: ribosome maturation factor RimM, partial [Stellaceae bacterium]
RLRVIGSAKGVLIATVSGVDDRDRAEALRGLRLYLPRAALPPPGEDEYYHADLIGLTAALADGGVLGRVSAVHDFGAGDTLEITRPKGPPLMVPFTKAVVPIVDLAAGRVVLDPPPGLMDVAPPATAEPVA